MATTDGSLTTMPLPRTRTSVFAVPRSMPMSRERKPSRPFIGLNMDGFLSQGRSRATACRGRLPGEAEPALLQANISLVTDDEVVEHVDVQQRARVGDLTSDLDVLGRGRGIATGVVVHHDHCRGILADRLAEQLGHTHDRRVQ